MTKTNNIPAKELTAGMTIVETGGRRPTYHTITDTERKAHHVHTYIAGGRIFCYQEESRVDVLHTA
jgi:hypothetical protein